MEEDKKSRRKKKELPEGNSALYCSVCATTTDALEKQGTTAVRIETLYDKTLCICEPCLKLLHNRLLNEEPKTKSATVKKMTVFRVTPSHLHGLLEKHIIGQDQAKKALAVAVSLHLKRSEGHLVDKSNVLLLGPTGTGKTEMARVISKILDLPLAIYDATSLTAHGYVGEDVEAVLQMLLASANGDVKKAEKGIVFLDEFDKLASFKGEYGVNTTAVQQSLLKMLEGGKIKVPKPGNQRKDPDTVTMDTSKILFICAGAFAGLEESMNRKGIGFGEDKKAFVNMSSVDTKDLVKFGLIPELLGRLPLITTTIPLSKEDLVRILREPETSMLSSFERAFKAYGLDVVFEKSFLEEVADKAMLSGLGARGLKKILEERLTPVLFEAPGKPGIKKVSIGKKIKYS